MKAIMYHYVRTEDPEYPNLKHLHFDDFRRQLDFFEKEYGFITKEDFTDCITRGITKKGVVLTFDDGFFCHYEFVFQELLNRNLWGIFYIPTKPYIDKEILDVHKVHLILSKYSPEIIYSSLVDNLDESFLDKTRLDEFRKHTYLDQKNDSYTLYIKRVLNYYIKYEFRNKTISNLMSSFFSNEVKIQKNFYLKKEQIQEMHNKGMIIGSHTVNHKVMSRLSEIEQKHEINNSFEYLNNLLNGLYHKTYCHPYGGFHSFNNKTEEILSKSGCLYSFNVENRDIESFDIKSRPHALPRYDCNFFKYGQVRN